MANRVRRAIVGPHTDPEATRIGEQADDRSLAPGLPLDWIPLPKIRDAVSGLPGRFIELSVECRCRRQHPQRIRRRVTRLRACHPGQARQQQGEHGNTGANGDGAHGGKLGTGCSQAGTPPVSPWRRAAKLISGGEGRQRRSRVDCASPSTRRTACVRRPDNPRDAVAHVHGGEAYLVPRRTPSTDHSCRTWNRNRERGRAAP